MKDVLRVVIAFATIMANAAFADEDDSGGSHASPAAEPTWGYSITAYPTQVRGGESYTSAIAVADRGQLHLEARYNYESVGARSAFVGWIFSGGENVTWKLTPLLGGAWGTTQAFVPGFEAAAASGRAGLRRAHRAPRRSRQRSRVARPLPGGSKKPDPAA